MKKSTVIFSAANVAGMLICLAFVTGARQQAIMEERDFYDFGDSLNFLIIVMPVLGICLLVNIAWAVMALVGLLRRRDYRYGVVCVVVVALWAMLIPITRGIASRPLNHPASGKAGIAQLLAIGYHLPGLPEPARLGMIWDTTYT